VGDMTWFRGEISDGATAKTGGAVLHDFFDGMYLTDDASLAVEYMDLRIHHENLSRDKGRVVATTFDPHKLGRVLDLRTDPRWAAYMREPTSVGLEQAIRMAQQNYSNAFQVFVQKYNINASDYAFVIGPEYVRRGNSSAVQICIVHPDGMPTDLSNKIRASLKPVALVKGGALPTAAPATPAAAAPKKPPPAAPNQPAAKAVITVPAAPPALGGAPKSTAGKVLSNQDAAAAIGMALGVAIQAIGDYGIRRRVENEVEVKQRPALDTILRRGEGVLIIVRLEQWKIADNNGMKARSLVGVYVCGGKTRDEALATWRNTPRLMQGPADGWEMMPEQYGWIAPSGP